MQTRQVILTLQQTEARRRKTTARDSRRRVNSIRRKKFESPQQAPSHDAQFTRGGARGSIRAKEAPPIAKKEMLEDQRNLMRSLSKEDVNQFVSATTCFSTYLLFNVCRVLSIIANFRTTCRRYLAVAQAYKMARTRSRLASVRTARASTRSRWRTRNGPMHWRLVRIPTKERRTEGLAHEAVPSEKRRTKARWTPFLCRVRNAYR